MVSNLKVLKLRWMNFVANCVKSACFTVILNQKRNLEFLHVVLEDGESKNV